MSLRIAPGSRTQNRSGGPRVGFFGLLGSGNLGNDGSFEAVLNRIRRDHPEAVVDAMCMGPERMSTHYGVPAIPLYWSTAHEGRTNRLGARLIWALGKVVDIWRTFSWVRQHDLVVVAGAGVLENSLPMRATGVPYAMFLLCASGKLARSRVALLSVGATKITPRPTRWLRNGAARLAYYRSYRDRISWEVMQQSGAFAQHDPVYTDLVFSFPAPRSAVSDPRLVGVGVMSFFGGSDDRRDGQQIHDDYIEAMTQFICWLVDHGYAVRLLSGDDSKDDTVIASVMADVSMRRPGLPPGEVVANHVSSLGDLLEEIEPVGFVVGARYHNVVSGLRLCKPTISVGYSLKHDALMSDMGVPEFAMSARSTSGSQLIERFTELQNRSSEVHATLETNLRFKQRELEGQFRDLASLVDSDPNGSSPRQEVTSRSSRHLHPVQGSATT
ncbi:MAG: polysaccharide pyruvyl transferase family protein [Acidimicrobiales bacterium]